MNGIVDALGRLWNSLLDVTSKLVIPDWGSLIGLLPIFLVIGVLGPLVTLLVLVWLYYVVRKPRAHVTYEEGPRQAPVGADGQPEFPAGEPYCLNHALIYPSGQTRCPIDGELLSVVCPKCGLGRGADIDTCGNCGLVLRIVPRARALRPAGPPPGGAAAA
ncbi:MAG TPA: hypothetical protein VFS32_08760 [Candidatus Limnocylindrales bacterium]|nr:hypothetical protein [Candidatus Limnocylindrales bacterium]